MKNLLIWIKSFPFTRFIIYSGITIAWFIGWLFTLKLVQDYKLDTTLITNSTFVILGALSALSFSWAQALSNDHEDKDRILFAGERLLHASLLLIVASVLKYGCLALISLKATGIGNSAVALVSVVLGIFGAPLYLFAVNMAHAGVLILYKLLFNQRATRYKEWDSLA